MVIALAQCVDAGVGVDVVHCNVNPEYVAYALTDTWAFVVPAGTASDRKARWKCQNSHSKR